MLDFFSILSKGGLVLWFIQSSELDFNKPVNNLIKDILIEDRPLNVYKYGKYSLECKVSNEDKLIFVAGYYSILNLSYVKILLDRIHKAFMPYFQKKSEVDSFSDFTEAYQQELKILEDIHRQAAVISAPIFAHSHPIVQITASDACSESPALTQPLTGSVPIISPSKPKSKGKQRKEARVWDNKINKEDAAALDYSEKIEPTKVQPTTMSEFNKGPRILKSLAVESSPMDTSKTSPQSSKLYGFFRNLVGPKIIDGENLKPSLQKMKEHLCSKNVAYDIAEKICESVSTKLMGTSLSTFGGIFSLLQTAMEESLINILTPKRKIDVLSNVELNKSSSKPYIIVFCGVNGVGKSTNLAKIAYYLLNNGQRILIAACDTFRSGAVEQLKTHVGRLNSIFSPDESDSNCKLYDKGYGKDASGVAMEAIRVATNEKYNVVLIDTAGRMQDNEPLMRSLAKLIKVNEPDLVLFVGEALVGNDGVDQLTGFNRTLSEYSESTNPHLIDGIVLTKFDTIDDKVGAALSMTYVTSQPIVFVGVGQTYADLRSLDVKSVVNLLLK